MGAGRVVRLMSALAVWALLIGVLAGCRSVPGAPGWWLDGAPALWSLVPIVALARGAKASDLGFGCPQQARRAAIESVGAAAAVGAVAVAVRPWFGVPGAGAGALLTTVLLVAPCEEAFFRGWFQARIRTARGPAVAIVLSAACFGISHAVVWWDWRGLLTAFPGLLFAVARERHGSLLTPWLLHATANVAVML